MGKSPRPKTMAAVDAENKKLRRKVARLEKSLQRYQDKESSDDDEPVETFVVVATAPVCAHCGGAAFAPLVTPTKTFSVCLTCKHRTESNAQ